MQGRRQARRRAGEARGKWLLPLPGQVCSPSLATIRRSLSSSVCMRSLAWAGRGDHVAGKPEEARLPGTSSALTARRSSGVPRIPRRGLRGPAGNPGLSRRPGPERRQVSPRLARVQVENMATSNLLKVSTPGFCPATDALGSRGRTGFRVSGEMYVRERERAVRGCPPERAGVAVARAPRRRALASGSRGSGGFLPPAERLAAMLSRDQPRPGARAVSLGRTDPPL